MPVDETPDRIVIYDLDAEIAAIEEAEAHSAAAATVFLPEIDKKVSSIPQELLQNGSQSHLRGSSAGSLAPPPALENVNTNTALVLYRDPTSISVPEEEDAVRKAIIAARTRVREKQAQDQRYREREREREQERRKPEAGLRYETDIRDDEIELDDAMTDHSSHLDEDLDPMDIE